MQTITLDNHIEQSDHDPTIHKIDDRMVATDQTDVEQIWNNISLVFSL